MPFFSVIIPTYNNAELISTAIESVIQQSFSDFEIIIVDDASTDNTWEIINQYNDQRIKCIRHKVNLERSASRNTGIRNATGKYICFLDSDDYYMDNHLELLHKSIKKRNFPVAFFYTNVSREENGKLLKVEVSSVKSINNPAFILETEESIIPPRVCIHSKILEKFKFDERINVGEDTDLWVRIVNEHPIYYVNEYTVVYKLHEDNTTNIANNPFLLRLKGFKRLFKKEVATSIPQYVKNKKISECYFGIAQYHKFRKHKLKMILSLLQSIIIYPSHSLTKHKVYLILTNLPVISYLLTTRKQLSKNN